MSKEMHLRGNLFINSHIPFQSTVSNIDLLQLKIDEANYQIPTIEFQSTSECYVGANPSKLSGRYLFPQQSTSDVHVPISHTHTHPSPMTLG